MFPEFGCVTRTKREQVLRTHCAWSLVFLPKQHRIGNRFLCFPLSISQCACLCTENIEFCACPLGVCFMRRLLWTGFFSWLSIYAQCTCVHKQMSCAHVWSLRACSLSSVLLRRRVQKNEFRACSLWLLFFCAGVLRGRGREGVHLQGAEDHCAARDLPETAQHVQREVRARQGAAHQGLHQGNENPQTKPLRWEELFRQRVGENTGTESAVKLYQGFHQGERQQRNKGSSKNNWRLYQSEKNREAAQTGLYWGERKHWDRVQQKPISTAHTHTRTQRERNRHRMQRKRFTKVITGMLISVEAEGQCSRVGMRMVAHVGHSAFSRAAKNEPGPGGCSLSLLETSILTPLK